MRGNAMNLMEVGALLKRERERCGISIRDVLDATKISRRNLTALEEGQVGSLPHPVYLKGYVRNIAKLVGLDANELAQLVDQQYDTEAARYLPQDSAEIPVDERPPAESIPEDTAPQPVQQPFHVAQNYPSDPERPRRNLFALEPLFALKPKISGTMHSVIVLILLVATLVVLLVKFQRMNSDVPPPRPALVAKPAASAPNALVPINATAASNNATGEEAALPEPPRGDMPRGDMPAPAATAPAPSAVTPTAPAPSVMPTAPVAAKPVLPATGIEVSRPALGTELHTPGMQRLTITAKPDEVCWVDVNDGKQSRSFTLRNGESQSVEFSTRMRVRLGNAGGVTFRLNGQDAHYEGKRGSLDTVEFGVR